MNDVVKHYEPEAIVLSGIMRNAKQREEYIELTDPSDFKYKGYSQIFKTFLGLVRNQAPLTKETVYNEFGDATLKSMVSFLYSSGIPPITQEVFSQFKKQGTFNRLVEMRDYLAQQINKAMPEEIPTIIEKIREMSDAIEGVSNDIDLVEPSDGVDKTIQMVEDWKRGDVRIKSFMPEMDAKLFLSRFVGLWVFGGKPSMGKTAMLCDIAYNNVCYGNPFVIFSLEMPEEMLRLRLAQRDPTVTGMELSDATMADEAKVDRLKFALEQQRKKPLYVYDKTFNIFSCYSKARALGVSKKVRGVGFDYMQLGQTSPTDSDVVRVSTVSTMLKLLTKGDIKHGWVAQTVLALSQYSGQGSGKVYETSNGNKGFKKTSTEYTDGDFRWSGQIQMDADGIVHIRGEKSEKDRVPVLLDCTKQRWHRSDWEIQAVFDKAKQVFETPRSAKQESVLIKPKELRDIDIKF